MRLPGLLAAVRVACRARDATGGRIVRLARARYKVRVIRDFDHKVRALSTEKAMAIAAYGESVAAFRYRMLSERSPTDQHRTIFTEMAEEEQGHHHRLQEILARDFAGADFVLSTEDKALVIVGPRILDVTTPESFAQSMTCIHDSEIQTGNFYARFHDCTTRHDLKPMLKEMADECFDHASRLSEIPGF